MNVSQCDNCKVIGPVTPAGWIVTGVIEQPQPSLLTMFGGGGGAAEPAMFCTWKCVAEYAWLKAVIPGGEVTA